VNVEIERMVAGDPKLQMLIDVIGSRPGRSRRSLNAMIAFMNVAEPARTRKYLHWLGHPGYGGQHQSPVPIYDDGSRGHPTCSISGQGLQSC
jgi:hypothetical protein